MPHATPYSRPAANRTRGFSLVELVIVIVIIGVLAAIAIPRFSQAASNAGVTALKGDLAVLRNALEMYAAEHGGTYPTATQTTFYAQLQQYTDVAGTTSAAFNETTAPYGPYLRTMPAMKIGGLNAATITAATNNPPTAGEADDEVGGWLYHQASGGIWANSTDDTIRGY